MAKSDFFSAPLEQTDPDIATHIEAELKRQQYSIELIASENIVSKAVMQAQGSVLTNKYAEGYAGRRYYGGCAHVDGVERLAIERLKQLFGCKFANVQPHSGAQANGAVFLALMQPGDTFLAMSLDAGGHLSHGAGVNISGKWFNGMHYGVTESDNRIDYDHVESLALEHKPKIIIAGGSAYPRTIDFARFRAIADKVGAYLMVDMAHFAGLVAGGAYPSPVPHAHLITSTTHKTLRGPRGGIILTNEAELAKKINSAVFPGYQGGPLMHVIAAKAVAFGEALQPGFKDYAAQIVKNARALGTVLTKRGFNLVSGGTDSHLLLVDVSPLGVTGKDAETVLEEVGLTCNKNAIPNDPQPPRVTSGIRLGTPAGTTRGFKEAEFEQVGELIFQTLANTANNGKATMSMDAIKQAVHKLCENYPIYNQELAIC